MGKRDIGTKMLREIAECTQALSNLPQSGYSCDGLDQGTTDGISLYL